MEIDTAIARRRGALEALISDGGQITLGAVGPIPNAAIAAMPNGMLAGLVRRNGETLPQILQRLDAALVQAVSENRVISELKLEASHLSTRVRIPAR